MRTWSDLQKDLQDLMGSKVKVYYQPPENLKLNYPCVIFDLNDAYSIHADNIPYLKVKRYSITLITTNADNEIYVDKLLSLPRCSMERSFTTDRLVHVLFNAYY